MFSAQKWGEGGGYIIFPWISGLWCSLWGRSNSSGLQWRRRWKGCLLVAAKEGGTKDASAADREGMRGTRVELELRFPFRATGPKIPIKAGQK